MCSFAFICDYILSQFDLFCNFKIRGYKNKIMCYNINDENWLFKA